MATVPVEVTIAAGSTLTAATWNANVRDAINFLLSTPIFEGRQTAAQSLTSGAATAILLDTEDVDTDNGHSTSSNTSRYTAQTAGRYQVGGGVSWSNNATGRRAAIWAINGVSIAGGEANMTTAVVAQPVATPARSRTVFLNVSDYVEIWGLQDSGGALNTGSAIAASLQCNMSVRWVGTT